MISCYFENGDEVELRHVVVSAIIVRAGKVLLSKRGTFKGKPMLEFGKWALLGGYADRDETLAQAIKREAMEEAGWKIDDVKLFRIVDNPDRPNDNGRQNVSMVYIAKAVSKKYMVNEEVSNLKWFNINDLPPKDSVAFDFYDSLELYKKYLNEKFSLPILG